MWLQGLWRGLGRELGARVKPEEIEADLEKRIRLKEPKLVKIYMKLYKPKEMILVTRCPTPSEIKRDLEAEGIEVLDDVQFSPQKLKTVSEKLLDYATPIEDVIILKGELAKLIRMKSRDLGKAPEEFLKEIIELI